MAAVSQERKNGSLYTKEVEMEKTGQETVKRIL